MARYDIHKKVSIPSIRSFRVDSLQKKQNYIIVGNFNYVPSEPKSLIMSADSLELKQSGLSNEVFFEVMWDFANRHGKKIVMFEEESLVITGGQKALNCLSIECGERFCYMLSCAEEIGDFCAHESEIISANASNSEQSYANEGASHIRLDS